MAEAVNVIVHLSDDAAQVLNRIADALEKHDKGPVRRLTGHSVLDKHRQDFDPYDDEAETFLRGIE